MKSILIAISDSENSSLPTQIDAKRRAYYNTLAQYEKENKNRSFDEVLHSFENPPQEIITYSRLVKFFEDRLQQPFKKYQNTKFESYTIDEVLSVGELIAGYEQGDWELFPQAILLPDTSWIDEGWSENDLENKRLEKEWEERVMSVLKQYRDKGIAIVVRCDS